MANFTYAPGTSVPFKATTDVLQFRDASASASSLTFLQVGSDLRVGTDSQFMTLLGTRYASLNATIVNTTFANRSLFLKGGADKDTLTGSSRDDYLDIAAGGADSVATGDGNDVIVVGAALTNDHRITGGSGIDELRLSGPSSAALGAATVNGVERFVVGNGVISLSLSNGVFSGVEQTPVFDARGQSSGSDSLRLDGRAVTAATGTSRSVIATAGAGADNLHGGSDGDDLAGNGGDDTIAGAAGNDTLDGGAGADSIFGDLGNDVIRYASSAEFIGATAGNDAPIDSVDGGDDADRIEIAGAISIGAAGADSLARVTRVEELRQTAAGASTVILGSNAALSDFRTIDLSAAGANASTVTLTGVTRGVTVIGGAGADVLTGGSGSDTLMGAGGADTLRGGEGDDVLEGSDGSDTAVFTGLRSDYTVVRISESLIRVSSVARGSDLLTSIETLQFADGSYPATVFQVNTPPTLTAVNTLAPATEDTAFTITYAMLAAAANEADLEGDPIAFRVEAVSSGALRLGSTVVTPGSTVLDAGQSLTWTPAANANGLLDAFTVRAVDSAEASASAVQVRVQTAPVNDVPSGAVVIVGTPIPGAVLTASNTLTDADGLGAITYTWKAGTITLGTGSSYTLRQADLGRTVTVTASYTDGGNTTETVTSAPTAPVGGVNNAPVGANAVSVTNEDTPLTATLPSATDSDGDTITYTRATSPANGTATVTATGNFTYTPAANYAGPDSFSYTVSDGRGGSNAYTVSLTVNPVNDAPVASDSALAATAGTASRGILSATDIDSATLTYTIVTAPGRGSVALGTNGNYTYTPNPNLNGPDSFTFRANDGSANSNIATVSISVAAAGGIFTGTPGDDLIEASVGNDRIAGGPGLDVVRFAHRRAEALISSSSESIQVQGPQGQNTLTGVERVWFADRRLAFDLAPQERGGQAALALGVLLPAALANPTITGLVLGMIDGGMDITGLYQWLDERGLLAALAGSTSPASIARMAAVNVLRTEPPGPLVDLLAGFMDGRSATYTPAQFLGIVANLPVNHIAVDLVGLQQSGLGFE